MTATAMQRREKSFSPFITFRKNGIYINAQTDSFSPWLVHGSVGRPNARSYCILVLHSIFISFFLFRRNQIKIHHRMCVLLAVVSSRYEYQMSVCVSLTALARFPFQCMLATGNSVLIEMHTLYCVVSMLFHVRHKLNKMFILSSSTLS